MPKSTKKMLIPGILVAVFLVLMVFSSFPRTEVQGVNSVTDLDLDGDGVEDSEDFCLGTESGTSVDEYGCSGTDLDAEKVYYDESDVKYEIGTSFKDNGVSLTTNQSVTVHHFSATSDDINIIVEGASGAPIDFTLSGLEGSTTFYKYREGRKNKEELTSNFFGSLSFTENISAVGLVSIAIQSMPSTIYIDETYPDYNAATNTVTLSSDIFDNVVASVNLDCAGHTIDTTAKTGSSVYTNTSGILISNCNIKTNYIGVQVDVFANHVGVYNNTITFLGSPTNYFTGVFVSGADAYIVKNNILQQSGIFGILQQSGTYGIQNTSTSNNLTIVNNTISNADYGIYLHGPQSTAVLANKIKNAWLGVRIHNHAWPPPDLPVCGADFHGFPPDNYYGAYAKDPYSGSFFPDPNFHGYPPNPLDFHGFPGDWFFMDNSIEARYETDGSFNYVGVGLDITGYTCSAIGRNTVTQLSSGAVRGMIIRGGTANLRANNMSGLTEFGYQLEAVVAPVLDDNIGTFDFYNTSAAEMNNSIISYPYTLGTRNSGVLINNSEVAVNTLTANESSVAVDCIGSSDCIVSNVSMTNAIVPGGGVNVQHTANLVLDGLSIECIGSADCARSSYAIRNGSTGSVYATNVSADNLLGGVFSRVSGGTPSSSLIVENSNFINLAKYGAYIVDAQNVDFQNNNFEALSGSTSIGLSLNIGNNFTFRDNYFSGDIGMRFGNNLVPTNLVMSHNVIDSEMSPLNMATVTTGQPSVADLSTEQGNVWLEKGQGVTCGGDDYIGPEYAADYPKVGLAGIDPFAYDANLTSVFGNQRLWEEGVEPGCFNTILSVDAGQTLSATNRDTGESVSVTGGQVSDLIVVPTSITGGPVAYVGEGTILLSNGMLTWDIGSELNVSPDILREHTSTSHFVSGSFADAHTGNVNYSNSSNAILEISFGGTRWSNDAYTNTTIVTSDAMNHGDTDITFETPNGLTWVLPSKTAVTTTFDGRGTGSDWVTVENTTDLRTFTGADPVIRGYDTASDAVIELDPGETVTATYVNASATTDQLDITANVGEVGISMLGNFIAAQPMGTAASIFIDTITDEVSYTYTGSIAPIAPLGISIDNPLATITVSRGATATMSMPDVDEYLVMNDSTTLTDFVTLDTNDGISLSLTKSEGIRYFLSLSGRLSLIPYGSSTIDFESPNGFIGTLSYSGGSSSAGVSFLSYEPDTTEFYIYNVNSDSFDATSLTGAVTTLEATDVARFTFDPVSATTTITNDGPKNIRTDFGSAYFIIFPGASITLRTGSEIFGNIGTNDVEASYPSGDSFVIPSGASGECTYYTGAGNVVCVNTGNVDMTFTSANGTVTVVGPNETYGDPDYDDDGVLDVDDQCKYDAGLPEFFGCNAVAEVSVALHTLDRTKSYCGGNAGTCVQAQQGVEFRVFDRNDSGFQSVAGSKNPDGLSYGPIWEAGSGLMAECTSGSSGTCSAGLVSTGDLLVIGKYVDSRTGSIVYTGLPEGTDDFIDTNHDGMVDTSSQEFQIIKVIDKDGNIAYRAGRKTIIPGSQLVVIDPDYVIWENSTEYYPFIFTSDSDWSVDVCLFVPDGYSVVEGECSQFFVQNETKDILFTVVDMQSPAPNFVAHFDLITPEGKKKKVDLEIPGIRKAIDSLSEHNKGRGQSQGALCQLFGVFCD